MFTLEIWTNEHPPRRPVHQLYLPVVQHRSGRVEHGIARPEVPAARRLHLPMENTRPKLPAARVEGERVKEYGAWGEDNYSDNYRVLWSDSSEAQPNGRKEGE